jgi:hypothetical protein
MYYGIAGTTLFGFQNIVIGALTGKIGFEVDRSIRQQVDRLGCKLVELNIQKDYVHLLIKVPPKISISQLMVVLKGKTAVGDGPRRLDSLKG